MNHLSGLGVWFGFDVLNWGYIVSFVLINISCGWIISSLDISENYQVSRQKASRDQALIYKQPPNNRTEP